MVADPSHHGTLAGRSTYEDYVDCEDYEDTDDYDALTEWSTLPEHVWSPYSQRSYEAAEVRKVWK